MRRDVPVPVYETRPLPPIRTDGGLAGAMAPLLRAAFVLVFAILAVFATPRAGRAAEQTDPRFRAFVAGLWPEAHAKGVSRRTFESAFIGVTPDPLVIARTQKQAELTKPVGDYLASAVSEKRIARGRELARQYGPVLERIERQYGVDRYVVLGVWGLETNFGSYVGDNSVIRALATLAYAKYRGTYFRHELVTALRILEEGHVRAAQMQGSWAGAMGQTQFMPTSFVRYAVDFDGDGRKNIWTSVPDALASTANYLSHHAWVRNWTWGYEVRLPARAGLSGDQKAFHPFTAWASAGLRRADGGPMPTEGTAALVTPAGPNGPSFLVTKNFRAIKTYNNSTAYALGVALLSDRIAGSGPLVAAWPQTDTLATGSIHQARR